jgi:hypothetical protein
MWTIFRFYSRSSEYWSVLKHTEIVNILRENE